MSIIKSPIITEKMTGLTEKLNRYGFRVDPSANKIEIKTAIESMYGVGVEAVKTMNYSGKAKSRFSKSGVINGRSNKYKKAIVTLVEGDAIDFYSNI